jgi:cystathionine gamma-synthase
MSTVPPAPNAVSRSIRPSMGEPLQGSPRNLLADPICEGDRMGVPIPDSPHAVSVALPRWQDVVDYEERKPEALARLQTGYPRFVYHARVVELARQIGRGMPCLPFPSLRTAELAAAFVRRATTSPAKIELGRGVYAVITDPAGSAALKAFWQHTGLIVSSRQAEAVLQGNPPDTAADEARAALRKQLAAFYECGESDIFLTPTGMAAHFAAWEAVTQRSPDSPTAQLGFCYVDTLKLQQKFGVGTLFYHQLETIDQDLQSALDRRPLAACFCEIPGNPLLGSVDVRKIQPILRTRGVPLVIDDVVATPANVNLRPYADLIATSLTKFIVGTGDAMGGALICNPASPFYSELKAIVQARHEELLWGADAAVLSAQARRFPERMQVHNRNGLIIAERLRGHPAIERVWYPKWEFSDAYDAVRRPEGGWGALITFLPRQAETRSSLIYDALRVSKGPSLGTVFTLACPFTLLAHYCELSWAESCGVSRHLIRLSIGLEDPDELWTRIEQALRAA